MTGIQKSPYAYMSIFAPIYVVGTILNVVIGEILPIDLGLTGSIAVLGVAAFFTVKSFVTDYGRRPNGTELQQLTLSSLVVSLLLSFVSLLVLIEVMGADLADLWDDIVRDVGTGLIVVLGLLGIAITYLLLLSCYHGFGKSAERRLHSR